MHTHSFNITLAEATDGENTYTCTSCNQPVVLVWSGYSDADGFHATNWGTRHEDASDEAIVNATINYL